MRAGDVIWNSLTGERAVILESRPERLVADFSVQPGGFVPGGEHVHDHLSEHLEVRSGRIDFVLAGEERVAGPGDELDVPPRTWHHWRNGGPKEVRITARIEPALRFGEAMLAFWGLCSDGHTNSRGQPSPLLGALVAQRYRTEIRYRQPPDLVQRTLFPLLSAIARRRGLERTLDRYLDIEAHPTAEAAVAR